MRLRQCDRQECGKVAPESIDFIQVDNGGYPYEFCSMWCLAVWAEQHVSPRESLEKGPIPLTDRTADFQRLKELRKSLEQRVETVKP